MLQKIRKWLPRILLEAALLIIVVLAIEAFLTRDTVSGRAPRFAGTTLQGERFDLAAFNGAPVVVHFWATWCPVCALEQGMVDGLAAGYPVITVAMQSGDAREVLSYLAEQGVNYPVINDPEGALAARYGVQGVPASFILDANGEVRFVTHGYTSGLGMRIRLWLAAVL